MAANIYKKIVNPKNKAILSEMISAFKWDYKYAKKYIKKITVFFLLGVFQTAFGLVSSVAFKHVIDAVIGKNLDGVLAAFIVTVAFSLSQIALSMITNRLSLFISLRITNDIIASVFKEVLNTKWEDIISFKSGDLLNRVNSDTRTVSGIVVSVIGSLLMNSIQMLGAFVIILYYDVTFAIISLLATPLLALIYKLLLRKMHDFSKETKKIDSELMAFNSESFNCIQVIKSFGIESFRFKNLIKIQKRFEKVNMDYNKISIIVMASLSIMGLLVNYACYAWGIFRLWNGAITFGTMTLFIQLAATLRNSFSSIIGIVPNLISASTSTSRIMELLNLKHEDQIDEYEFEKLKNKAKNSNISLHYNDVDLKYKNNKPVLTNININIKENDIVALIGTSGGGKTTMFRSLLGLLAPSKGVAEIILNNESKEEKVRISEHTRKLFSYVPQGNTVFSGTIAENLRAVNPQATDEDVEEALKAACVYDFVKSLPDNINSVIGENGSGISEGQAQRIAIARAIICDSPVILFDEATSALDSETERKVLENVKNLSKKKLCIFSTHRYGVLDICSKVYHVSNEQVNEISLAQAKDFCSEI